MEDESEKVLETIGNPDIIQRCDRNELMAFKFYERTPLSSKYIVVIYRGKSST
jgi:hypothetical protein